MLTGPTRCAFRDIGVIAVKLEHFACIARLLDQLLLPLRWDRYGTRLAGGQMHGGSISEGYRWEADAGPFFVKLAPARGSAMLEAEAAGLEELRRAQAVRVPRVMSVGTTAGKAWLALEWIESGAPSRATDA